MNGNFCRIGNKSIISIQVPKELINNKNVIQPQIHIVLDISGSMSGSFLNNAKIGIIELINRIKNSITVDKIKFYTFDNKCYFHGNFADYKSLTDKIEKTRCGGSTSFTSVINMISKSIKTASDDNHIIILFTDGHDNCGSRIEYLKDIMTSYTIKKNSQIHSIGIGGDHDDKFLINMTALGNIPGTYQNCSKSSMITESINNLIGVMNVNMVNIEYYMENSWNNGFIDDGVLTIISNDINPTNIVIRLDNTEYNSDVTETQPNELTISEYLKNLRNTIVKMTEKTNLTFNDVQTIDIELNNTVPNIRKQPSSIRKELGSLFSTCKNIIVELHKKIRKEKTSDGILRDLISKSYSYDISTGLQKRLAVRAEKNGDLEEEVENNVDKAFSQINFDELEIPNDYNCIMSCNDVKSAMQEKDVMCLTFNITRNESTTMNPETIKINKIGSSNITYKSFMDSVLYGLNSHRSDESVHGGFGTNDTLSYVIKGGSREEINAIIPMYINKEHWSMAKEYMKPLFGWMCTLDVLGYQSTQMIAIPFALLTYVKSLPQSEFNDKYKYEVEQVCIQICNMFTSHFDDVIDRYNNFIDNPLSRTQDQITNLGIFLVQIGVLKSMDKYKNKIAQHDETLFSYYLIEETLRRSNRNFFNNPSTKSFSNSELINILSIDEKENIKNAREKYVEYMRNLTNTANEIMHYRIVGSKLLGREENVASNNVASNNVDESANIEFIEPSIVINNNLNIDHPSIQKFYQNLSKSCDFYGKVYSDFVNYDFTNDHKIALMIQTVKHLSNSDRRNAITNGEYTDFYKNNSNEYLNECRKQLIKKMRESEYSAVKNMFSQNNDNKLAAIFCSAEDIETAIGALHGIYLGRPTFMRFFEQLCESKCPISEEKFLMLIKGHYNGVRLTMDQYENETDKFYTWKPSKKNCNSFKRMYGHGPDDRNIDPKTIRMKDMFKKIHF